MNRRMVTGIGIASALLAATLMARAQQEGQTQHVSGDVGTPDAAEMAKQFPKRPYSPYAGRNFPTRPLFGDTHLHTSLLDGRGRLRCTAWSAGGLSVRQG